MQPSRFDDLARALARGTSRRAILRSVLAGAAGTALAAVRGASAKAQARDDCRAICFATYRPGPEREACMENCARGGERCIHPQTGQVTAVCGAGEYCCNASCGICAPVDGSCTQQYCRPGHRSSPPLS